MYYNLVQYTWQSHVIETISETDNYSITCDIANFSDFNKGNGVCSH